MQKLLSSDRHQIRNTRQFHFKANRLCYFPVIHRIGTLDEKESQEHQMEPLIDWGSVQ